MNWAVFKPSDKEILPIKFGHGDLNDLRDALVDDQVQYGIMRLTFGEGRFKRSWFVFIIWSPDSMTQNVTQKIRKKRMDTRFKHVGYRAAMQKLIGPYSVEVLAEARDQVTLEDWILRVRKTVVVDGKDGFINAEAFRKALESEKAHFEEVKRKREEEAAKKKAEEEANKSTEEEEEVDEPKDKKKKKKKKKKKSIDVDNDDDKEHESDENETEQETIDESAKIEEEKAKEKELEAEKAKKEEEERIKKEEEEKLRKIEEERIKKEKIEKENELIELEKKTKEEELEKSIENAKQSKEDAKKKRLEELDNQAQNTYECVILMKNPETSLTWILLRPHEKKMK